MCGCPRGSTVFLVCAALVLGTFGVPSAGAVGQILPAPGSTVNAGYSTPNTITGFVHRLLVELPKPMTHRPDQ
jgi:hypothetical protein